MNRMQFVPNVHVLKSVFCSHRQHRINGDETVTKLFTIDSRSGQLAIRTNSSSALDVTHLHSEHVFFTVEVKRAKQLKQ